MSEQTYWMEREIDAFLKADEEGKEYETCLILELRYHMDTSPTDDEMCERISNLLYEKWPENEGLAQWCRDNKDRIAEYLRRCKGEANV